MLDSTLDLLYLQNRMATSTSSQSLKISAELQWQQRKAVGEMCPPLDTLMNLIGLEEVNQAFLIIRSRVCVARVISVDLKEEHFGAVFSGSPGTGKFSLSHFILPCF